MSVRRREIGPRWLWALFAVCCGLIWLFVELADYVGEAEDLETEANLLLLLREPGAPGDPIGPHWLEHAARDMTSLGSNAVLALLTAAVLGYLWLARLQRTAIAFLCAMGGATLLTVVLKEAFARPRPIAIPALIEVSTASFPSGHSLLSAVTYPTLGALLAGMTATGPLRIYVLSVALAVAVLVGLTRAYLGVHYPSDIAAGWALGFAWAILCFIGLKTLARRGVVEPEASASDDGQEKGSNGTLRGAENARGSEMAALEDHGPHPFTENIEKATLSNENYRATLWTGKNLQLTVMSIEPGHDIGLEIHPDHDQFLRIEAGKGRVQMGPSKDDLSFERVVEDDWVVLVPAGSWHNITNIGDRTLKVYSLYAPPEHPHGTVHRTKAEADADEHG